MTLSGETLGSPRVFHEECDPPEPDSGCSDFCESIVCGNRRIDPGETCDDGNTVSGDGCSQICQTERCGNGQLDPGEQCDDGNTVTEVCPYAASCTVCDSTCRAVPGEIPRCGDGNVDEGHELCDDGNTNGCGTCSSDCQIRVSFSPAVATLTVAPGSDYLEGDGFTLKDGVNAVTFVFTSRTAPAGSVPVPFTPTDDAPTVASRLITAINASGVRIEATPATTGPPNVRLAARQPGAIGNQPITVSHLPNSFGRPGSMNGGTAGNCGIGVGCALDRDCASNLCDTESNACESCAVDGDCATELCTAGRCLLCFSDSDCAGGRQCFDGACSSSVPTEAP